MATLTRARSEHEIATPATIMTNYLESSIPTPFPRERLVGVDDVQFVPSQPSEPSERQVSSSATTEIMPSIAFVERSCLMTLNNLLSVPLRWNPIVPDRRHSMPNTPHIASTSTEAESSSSALQTLVSNLRTRDFGDEMVEMASSDNDSDLIHELNSRVDGLSSSLLAEDAKLAKSLVSLLSYLHRLSTLFASSRGNGPHQQFPPPLQTSVSDNIFDTLKRQLSDLQVERKRDILPPGSPPVLAVESALLWSRIDEELESVLVLCKERTTADHLPPQYDRADYEFDTPPEYDYQANMSLYDSKETSSHAPQSPTLATSMNEKMRLDFEAVTMAIDRLYLVAPQLHNQRVELKSSKLAQMEKARREGGQNRGKGKQKQSEPDIRELENIFELLGKATDRAMKDQSVILDGGMKSRLERARQRDEAKREAFVDQLAQHSSAGRLHSQDAILQPPRVKNPEAMLTLPEFIRESVPESLREYDPDTMMSLPEFVRENPPSHLLAPSIGPSASMPLTASAGGTLRRLASATKKNRDRSMSAPSPLSWLRHSASRSALSESKSKVPSRSPTPKVDFEVSYIAENHENLNHILVFVSVNGVVAGTDVEAEVSPSLENSSFGSNRLIIKCGSQTSMPLALPGHVHCGKKEMRAQSGHYEIKLTTIPPTTPSPQPAPLLDAAQLSDWNPTTFVCDSCSLPVVHSSKISQYRDLPSEHWQELVDAWMCHPDQKLHDQVVQSGSKGFWPESGQALVGGSYILFEESAVSKINIHARHSLKGDKEWQPVLCLCGAALGRCQQAPPNTDRSVVYRLLKYAIRPVSPTAEPIKVPLSAFIVEDMIEFVHAHASYRFVVLDEEEEKPRILIWLFKPNIQLAYTARTHYSLPKSANMHAAKVLFKLVGPSEERTDLKSILNKYPGFPQAEYLFYSMNVCRRIAGYLRESNRTYPDSMRTMTDLEVGWLRRF